MTIEHNLGAVIGGGDVVGVAFAHSMVNFASVMPLCALGRRDRELDERGEYGIATITKYTDCALPPSRSMKAEQFSQVPMVKQRRTSHFARMLLVMRTAMQLKIQ